MAEKTLIEIEMHLHQDKRLTTFNQRPTLPNVKDLDPIGKWRNGSRRSFCVGRISTDTSSSVRIFSIRIGGLSFPLGSRKVTRYSAAACLGLMDKNEMVTVTAINQ